MYDVVFVDKCDVILVLNMIKKFINEGYLGIMSILCGGFNVFVLVYLNLVDCLLNMMLFSLLLGGVGFVMNGIWINVLFVIGGVMLLIINDKIDLFFSNIC